jgi:hypothetical protein
MHPLIQLNRAYASGEITLEEVFEELKSSAPTLFIEVPDLPQSKRAEPPVPGPHANTPIEGLEDLSFDEPVSPAAKEAQKIAEATKWMTDHTTAPNYPYDDFGNIPPLS